MLKSVTPSPTLSQVEKSLARLTLSHKTQQPSMNIWLHARCRRYIDPDGKEDVQVQDAQVQVNGSYDGNSTGA